MIDCKNDNCYYALYKKTDDDILDVLIEPQAETVVATLSIIDTYIEDSNETGNIYFTGDATTKYKNDIEVFGIEDSFFHHGDTANLRKLSNLDCESIINKIQSLISIC